MSDEQITSLLEQIQALCDRVRYLEEDNRRTHERLKAQIAQNGELIRQGRKLDGESAPQYVTGDDRNASAYEIQQGYADAYLAQMPDDMSS